MAAHAIPQACLSGCNYPQPEPQNSSSHVAVSTSWRVANLVVKTFFEETSTAVLSAVVVRPSLAAQRVGPWRGAQVLVREDRALRADHSSVSAADCRS